MNSRARNRYFYRAIKELHKIEKISIKLLCDISGVSRSGYYKWLNHRKTKEECENDQIVTEILKIYDKVKDIYGYRRMTMNINRNLGAKFNSKRIYRIMKVLNLKSVIRKKKKRYTPKRLEYISENILNRNFNAESINEKWLTDVTEFKYGKDKKAYLSAILDLYDRSIVSYVIDHRNNNDLVFRTLNEALQKNSSPPLLIHSDRGYQYTSIGFKNILKVNRIKQSMSRVGKCIDNGPMEGFWGILKSESYYLDNFQTFEKLREEIDRYIKFYNEKRLQKNLNSQSPLEFRALAT